MGHSRHSSLEGAREGGQGSDEQQSVNQHKATLHRSEAVCKPTCRPRHRACPLREAELRVAEAERIKCRLLCHR